MGSVLGLADSVKKGFHVWVVWPRQCGRGTVGEVVRHCLSLGCRITVLTDSSALDVTPDDLPGATLRAVNEWMDPAGEAAVVRAAFDLACRWFDSSLQDETLVWRGVRLGEMVEHTLPPFALVPAIRLIEALLRWVECERPEAVVLVDSRHQLSQATCQVMRQQGVLIALAPSGRIARRAADLVDNVKRQLTWGLVDLWDTLIRSGLAGLGHAWGRLRGNQHGENGPLAVLVGFEGNQYKHILPIARELMCRKWRVSVLRGLEGKTVRASSGISCPTQRVDSVDGYITLSSWHRCRNEKRRIRRIWEQLARTGALAGSFTYRGVDLWPLVENQVRYCFHFYLPTAVRYMELTREIIAQEHPKVFIFGNESGPRGHGMIAIARQHGIPTLEVQHGLAAEPWVYVTYADTMVIWGEHSRKTLVDWGARPDKLVCLGAPGLDDLMPLAADEVLLAKRRTKACKQLGIHDAVDLVLLLTGYPIDSHQVALIRMAFRVAKELSMEDRLVVKPHPRDMGVLHEKIASDIGVRPRVTRNVDLWGVIAASRVVITTLNSTAGLEALILGRPVIAVKTGEFLSVYANTTGLVREVGTEQELRAHLRDVLSSSAAPNGVALEWFIGALDGRASVRAANLVEVTAGMGPDTRHELPSYPDTDGERHG